MIILIFPPRGKIRQIVFDPYPYKAALRMKFNHRAKDIFLFGLFTFWTQFVNEYFCRVFTLLIKLNDTNAGVLCTVREKVKQFQFAEIAIFLDMEPIGGTFKVLYEINGEIRRSPFPSTNKSNDKINGRIRQR